MEKRFNWPREEKERIKTAKMGVVGVCHFSELKTVLFSSVLHSHNGIKTQEGEE